MKNFDKSPEQHRSAELRAEITSNTSVLEAKPQSIQEQIATVLEDKLRDAVLDKAANPEAAKRALEELLADVNHTERAGKSTPEIRAVAKVAKHELRALLLQSETGDITDPMIIEQESYSVAVAGSRKRGKVVPSIETGIRDTVRVEQFGEDVAVTSLEKSIAAVADGNSGLQYSSEVAKRVATVAVNELAKADIFAVRPDVLEQVLTQSMLKELQDIPGEGGATVAAVRVFEKAKKAIICIIGDAEVYKANASGIEQLQHPPTRSERLRSVFERMGVLTKKPIRAKSALDHGVVKLAGTARILDERDEKRASVFVVDVAGGDEFILCSDGVRNNLKKSTSRSAIDEATANTLNVWRESQSSSTLPKAIDDDVVVARIQQRA